MCEAVQPMPPSGSSLDQLPSSTLVGWFRVLHWFLYSNFLAFGPYNRTSLGRRAAAPEHCSLA